MNRRWLLLPVRGTGGLDVLRALQREAGARAVFIEEVGGAG